MRGFERGSLSRVCATLCSLLLCTAVFAQPHLTAVANASAPAPLKLAIAGGDHWSTDLGLNALPDAVEPVDVFLSSCQQGSIHLVPSGSFYFEQVTSSLFCGGQPTYYLIDKPAGANAFTMLSFHDGANRSSFEMPAIGAVVPGAPQTFGLDKALTNTARYQVYVLCGFPDYEGTLDVDVYDGLDAHKLTTTPERIDCSAPITLRPLKTQFQSGHVVVANSSSGLPGWGQTIYGAIVNSSATNGNARIDPFR